jgi:SAM-dependent methyltransferase
MKIWEDMIAVNAGATFDFTVLPPITELPPAERSYIKIHPSFLSRSLAEYEALDRWPVPLTSDREHYHHDRHRDYWLSGLRDYLTIRRLLTEQRVVIERYFELGCSTGRTMRHFLANEPGIEVWGTDLNYRSVAWLHKYLPAIRAFQCSSIPTLPLEDRYFDFICAFSVFTHIETFVETWIAELRRVLRPGGIAWLTVHTEYSVQHMTENWPLYKALSRHPDYKGKEETLRCLTDRGRLIFRHRGDGSYRSNVVSDSEYLKSVWGRFFEVIEVKRAVTPFQDVFVLKKPGAAAA